MLSIFSLFLCIVSGRAWGMPLVFLCLSFVLFYDLLTQKKNGQKGICKEFKQSGPCSSDLSFFYGDQPKH